MTKVQPPVAPGGRFAKDRFVIDPDAGTVTLPATVSVPIRAAKGRRWGRGLRHGLRPVPLGCPRHQHQGRTQGQDRPPRDQLVRARATQKNPAWRADYRATRPKVERKIGHLMRRRHGGRRAGVRGRAKFGADFSLLAAAVNLARFGVLGATSVSGSGWAVATS